MSMNNPNVTDNWYTTAFDSLYPVVYAHRTVEAAAPEAAFAQACVRLGPSDRVLDLACGSGRHLVHLLKATPHAVGLDYSPDLLRLARRELGPGIALIRGDMRRLPFRSAFDCITNFFTSFGYFTEEAENLAAAQQIAAALRTGGRFFIDHACLDHVLATLVPQSQRKHQAFVITEERWIDAGMRVNKVTRVSRQGKSVTEYQESVQLYTPEGLRNLLQRAGLVVDACYGDYDGSSVDPGRPRMIIVGHKE
ncbi:MAG: class I SAM-dependent methyltransferase [Candidatus Hydrogenedentes bacterium]|nr:class I SAM-dependent methyltransferase [Candidatus Hydrogenedentota bacterium]